MRMNSALKHRGPDDHGIVVCGDVCLGNTRLAVIDTSHAGHQPMNDPETGNWITFNGETYNFKQLRKEIDSDSRVWRSSSDTEVVLRAYRKWGIEAFYRLRGMFALGLWDESRRMLLLARDQLGIKPLYYYRTENSLLFASELRALLATGLVPRELCSDGLDSYLASGSVEAPLTIVKGVRQLLPGQYLQAQKIAERKLDITIDDFNVAHREVDTSRSRAEAVARLRSELEESVRLHLVSDVPLGVFLSGGVDSSAMVALTSRISGETPRTFSVVFDERAYSEAPYARTVAAKFRTDHSEVRLNEEQLLEMLPQALTSLDQPTMDGINTFVVSKAVKNAGVTVALSGLGGDELFGGYPSFKRALQFASLPKASKQVLRAAAGVGRHVLNGSIQREKFWQLAGSDGSPNEVYRISRQLFSTRSNETTDGNGDVVNTISQLELKGYMANTLLRDTDVMSMAHSLEVRVPFVDVKVVDYALSLPGEWKLDQRSNGVPKPLLADAVADLLPRDFLARRKMGFTLPFEKWMQGRLRARLSAVFADDRRLTEAGLVARDVRELWRRFLKAPRAVGWTRPWSLFVLAQWCELNRVAL